MRYMYASTIDGIPCYLYDSEDSAAATALNGLAVLHGEWIYEIDDKPQEHVQAISISEGLELLRSGETCK